MKVGVLALQGDVPEHVAALRHLLPPESVVPVRTVSDLDRVVALFLPGGESTTIGRLLEHAGLDTALRERGSKGFPILATCAGLILISGELEPSPGGRDPHPLGLLDVRVRRNDYGRQRESFEGPVTVSGLDTPFPGVFIRAPRILKVGPGAQPLALHGEEVVGVRQGHLWGLTFHPELSGDPRLHALFLAETLGFLQPATARAKSTATSSRATPTRTASQ
ncbi:MAG TPA: pyridoxal 5'-phosphate synthase glutaminase subunit PdxT [Thermoplasmata archaeon]|nr:pyridoxal 5'-phosphate synthase glutaminase subunit PdxT [Thermoplasmata archaeon]